MLSREENELLVRTGPGTAMGTLIRRYWVPVLFSKQLPEPDGPPVRVTVMSEKLVAFRDSAGRVGLFDERCPHRGASMFFGRNEEAGLRCVYHGWKFDVTGQCVDMPSEPAESNFRNKVRIDAYPCLERGGVVWAYMGPAGLKPAFPDIEWTMVPDSQRYATRHIQECNFFQALEGGFDNSHVAFLHRGDGSARPGVPRGPHVGFEALSTDYGFVVGGGRAADDQNVFWTASMFLMPFHKLISRVPVDGPIGVHAWVPIDDQSCMNWTIEYHPDRPMNERELEQSTSFRSIHPENIPGTDHSMLNPRNDYRIDRALQKSGKSYTGIKGVGIQDAGIQESMGPIVDRTREHLGTSDKAIVQIRRFFQRALADMAEGRPLPGMNAASYRVRPSGFTIPKTRPYADAVGEFTVAA